MLTVTWMRHGGVPDDLSNSSRGTMSVDQFMENCNQNAVFIDSTAMGTILGWYDEATDTSTWTEIEFKESN